MSIFEPGQATFYSTTKAYVYSQVPNKRIYSFRLDDLFPDIFVGLPDIHLIFLKILYHIHLLDHILLKIYCMCTQFLAVCYMLHVSYLLVSLENGNFKGTSRLLSGWPTIAFEILRQIAEASR